MCWATGRRQSGGYWLLPGLSEAFCIRTFCYEELAHAITADLSVSTCRVGTGNHNGEPVALLVSDMAKLTHLDEAGEVRMVDVGDKPITRRFAAAEGRIHMQSQTLQMIISGGHKKGDVLAVARVAGIMAAKKTAELIPLCHPLSLTKIELDLQALPGENCVQCRATAETRERTGVEMEALVAVQIALLTIYDMCKAVDRGMAISGVRLLEKSGGRSGNWKRPTDEPTE